MNLRLHAGARGARIAVIAALAGSGLLGQALAPPCAHASDADSLRIDSPLHEQRVRRSVPWLEVRGRTGAAELYGADVVIAVDLSRTALLASGVDVDRDGTLGETREWAKEGKLPGRHERSWTSDPDDTVFEAEMLAARAIVRALAQRDNRVGVLTYTEVPRTRARVGPPETALAALDRIRQRNDSKGTDVARALEAGARMLEDPAVGLDPRRPRALLLFTDGGVEGDAPSARPRFWARRAALASARELQARGIAIYLFSFGEQEDEDDQFLFDLAEAARAPLIPVERPRRLLVDLPSVDLEPLRLRITNLTTGSAGRAVRTSRDGWFDGFVELCPGGNEIEVRATLLDGSEVSERRRVVYEKPEIETEADRRRAARLLVLLRERTAEVAREAGPEPGADGAVPQ